VRTFFGQEGSSYMNSAHFSAKNIGFFEIYGVSARTRGWGVEPVRTFFGQGGRRSNVNFLRFCADVLYGRPLMSLFLDRNVEKGLPDLAKIF